MSFQGGPSPSLLFHTSMFSGFSWTICTNTSLNTNQISLSWPSVLSFSFALACDSHKLVNCSIFFSTPLSPLALLSHIDLPLGHMRTIHLFPELFPIALLDWSKGQAFFSWLSPTFSIFLSSIQNNIFLAAKQENQMFIPPITFKLFRAYLS